MPGEGTVGLLCVERRAGGGRGVEAAIFLVAVFTEPFTE